MHCEDAALASMASSPSALSSLARRLSAFLPSVCFAKLPAHQSASYSSIHRSNRWSERVLVLIIALSK